MACTNPPHSRRTVRIRKGAGAALCWVLIALPAGLVAQEVAPTLRDLAFLAGCWEGEFSSRGRQGIMRESYTLPTENILLGNTRYTIEGRTTSFELTSIEATDDGVLLTPYPNGNRSPDPFVLTRAGDGQAVFEAPEHDFPKRILYSLGEDGRLYARIDGGPDSDQAREWTLHPASCP